MTGAQANSPLKLLIPRTRGASAWVFASTFGGGLVDGDRLRINADLAALTTTLLSTQASTKIYRGAAGCQQILNVAVAEGAVCVSAPHPVTCFRSARYTQRQRFDLAEDATLVLVDWLTSGRHAVGERWQFDYCDLRTDIFVGRRHVLRDALRLSPDDGPIDSFHRAGGFDCLATVVLLGPKVAEAAQRVMEFVGNSAVESGPAPLLFSASPLSDGAIVRVAGYSSQTVGRWIRERLAVVPKLLGEDPWARL